MILPIKILSREGNSKDELVASFERARFYARKYVLEHLSNLEMHYSNHYLAIAENVGIIDSDGDMQRLIQRLQEKGDQRCIAIDTIANLIKPQAFNN